MADKVVSMLANYTSGKSIVVGIEGEWGSGKTSFVNMIVENLNKDKFSLVKFNPWNFSNESEIVKDFFNTIMKGLKDSRADTLTNSTKLQEYSAKLIEGSTVTVSGGLPGILQASWSSKRQFLTLEDMKEDINNILKSIEKKLIIVVDDIDRLGEKETRLIFKLVKLSANFDNTIFLLCYDRIVVSKQLSEGSTKGEEFLKKIVQVGFPMPKPDRQVLFSQMCQQTLDEIKHFDEKYWDSERWDRIVRSGFPLFKTIRDLNRYLNSLRLDLSMIDGGEINPLDFCGVEFIRVFTPEVYSAMAYEKDNFTAGDNEWLILHYGRLGGKGDSRECRKKTYEEIMNKSPLETAGITKGILQELFPQVNDVVSDKEEITNSTAWRKELRVCSGDMFEKYFQLAIPSASFSEASLSRLLDSVDGTESCIAELRRFDQDNNNLVNLLDRLLDFLDEIDDHKKMNLLVGVLNVCKDVRGPLFSYGGPVHFGYQTLQRVEKSKRFEFMNQLFQLMGNSLLPVRLVQTLEGQVVRNKKDASIDILLTEDEIDSLRPICVAKIRESAKNGTLLMYSQRFSSLLFSWKDWGSESEVNDYIESLLETTEGLFSFLEGFVSEYYGVNISDGTRRKQVGKEIRRSSITHHIDIERINRRISQIDRGSLNSEQSEILDLYQSSNPN